MGHSKTESCIATPPMPEWRCSFGSVSECWYSNGIVDGEIEQEQAVRKGPTIHNSAHL
jgi:hypothetical protein